MKPVISLFTFLVYPIWFPVHVYRNKEREKRTKVLAVLFSLFVLLPVWVGSYIFISIAIVSVLRQVGVMPVQIPVSGASMLPTIEEKGLLTVHRYPEFTDLRNIRQLKPYVEKLRPDIERGDIVVFKDIETVRVFDQQNRDARKQGGFVKRVVGVPGDVVTIRNGFVRVNGEVVDEPYTLKPRSTFGGDVIRDCSMVEVPEGSFFVLGDNRKVSLDSRHLGLVKQDDVKFYLSYQKQVSHFSSRWRDTSSDQDSAFSSELDAQEYVRLLNEKRQERGIDPLKLEPKLSDSAELRAKIMLEYDDMSFEATKSGYTIEDAFEEVGYSNIVYGEFPTIGYYDAQELIDSFFEYPGSQEFLLHREYQEIGLSTFVGFLQGCPVQIVVQHLAGYKPPNYSQKDINQWNDLVSKLQDIKPGWIELKGSGSFYEENKKDIDRINDIIRIRSARAKQIIERMEQNEWFTAEEERFIEEDQELFDEQNAIADRLNKILEEKAGAGSEDE
ncbi:MAG: signal peptidase I [Patescibacteria group bacterium]